MPTITKKQFEEVYRKFSPSGCEIFYLKNLSLSSLHIKPLSAILSSVGLILPFIFALMAECLNWSHILIYLPTFIYTIILATIGIFSLAVWIKRSKRIKNICKELKLDIKQYHKIVEKYYYENYYPDIKDYINNILLED